eukprot:scaffold16735_cov33-Tisochrysis_lutea.AAC.3
MPDIHAIPFHDKRHRAQAWPCPWKKRSSTAIVRGHVERMLGGGICRITPRPSLLRGEEQALRSRTSFAQGMA